LSQGRSIIRRIFLTGPPTVGKTTLMRKLLEHYSSAGVMVNGVITEEALSGGVSTGFRIRSVMSGEEGWLATKKQGAGPKVGSYTVNTADLERIGAGSLRNAARGEAPLVLIDEVGPMEMTSPVFREALAEVFKSNKTAVTTVKYGSNYKEVDQVSKLRDSKTFIVSKDNRDSLLAKVVATVDEALGR
jgi:nucleoside-triphosphatase